MPIRDMQIRMRELGRIRTGIQVPHGRGTRPEKLSTFRLTTASEALAGAVAQAYGGTVAPWQSPAGKEWEVVTEVASLPVVIPPGQQLSQWYELWTGGGCQRRCDGETNVIADGPCECPADPAERREAAAKGEACKPTTRLNVILPDLPDLGMWRLESHGYYAAVELAGAAQFLAIASARGMNIPASLRLEQREKKVPGKPTNRYAVPVIEFTTTRIADLLASGPADLPMLGEPTGSPQLAPGALAPAKAPRTRREKAERPSMGTPPPVPTGNGFAKPVPVAPEAPPIPAGWTIEPPKNGHSDPEDQQVAPDATPAPVAAPGAVPGAVGLSRQALLEVCGELGVTPVMALAKAKELAGLEPPGEPLHPAFAGWPGNRDLTNVQRGVLAEALRAEKSEAAVL